MQLFSRSRQPGTGTLLLFSASLFGACLLGIFSRPDNLLAVIWPANALLLGWLLRQRRLAGVLGWSCAALAYLAADLVTGSSVELTVHMAAANLAGVAVGYTLLRHSPHFNRLLLGPASVLMLLLASLSAAWTSALVAMPATTFLLGAGHGQALLYWFSAELVWYMALLPAILLTSSRQSLLPPAAPRFWRWAPLLALAASALLAIRADGAGALAFTLPALLWCALRYRQGLAALCLLITSIGTLYAVAIGLLELGSVDPELGDIVSLRTGVALLAVPVLLVSAMNASRERMLKALHHAAAHDGLTGLLSRAGFFSQLPTLLQDTGHSIGTLMLDIDLFKQINDHHGHAAGDLVLREVAQRLRTSLPDGALLGRLGGEEFAVVLPAADLASSRQVAEQLRQRIDEEPFVLLPGLPPLAVSVSIGVAALGEDDERHVDTALHPADQALQRAKNSGRNRVVVAP